MLTPNLRSHATIRPEMPADPELRAFLSLNLALELAQQLGQASRAVPRRRADEMHTAARALLEHVEQA